MTISMDSEAWDSRYEGSELLWTAQPNRFLVAETAGLVPARALDLVLVFYLQLPEAGRRTVLRAAAEAVAPGGTLLLVAHDSSNLEHGHGGPQHPSVLYTPADVATDLAGSGLELERAHVVERPVQTPEGERIALDALVRARRPTA
jgi:hypothetical protein